MSININILSNFNGSGFNKLEKELNRLTTPIEKVAAVSRSLAPAAVIGLTALTGMAVGALRAAEEAEVANNRISSITKTIGLFGAETGKVATRIQEFAESQEKLLAIDADVIKSFQAQLLTFKGLAQTADEAGGAFDRATIAALDMNAANIGGGNAAIQLGKALENPIKGITALTKSGVTFTEQETEKIKALVESGNLLEAQDTILRAIEGQVGGTAEATATGSEKMRLAFLAMEDSIGNALMPAFDVLVPVITDFFGFLEENNDVLVIIGTAMAALAVAILAVNFALNANPIIKIITLITVLATAVALLINWLVELYGGWTKLFKDIGAGFVEFVLGIGKGLDQIDAFFLAVFTGIGAIVKGALNGMLGFVEGYINFIISGINGLLGAINRVLSAGKAIGINLQIPTIPTLSIPRLAEGGIVMPRPGGVLANIAEGGQAEAVIPLDRMKDFGGKAGNTYNITVNGGVGSGATIGKSIVDAIKAYERSSGAVWQGA
jgi:hypothetical protein